MKTILFIILYFLGWFVTSIFLTIYDYIDTNLRLDDYLDYRVDDIISYCWASLLWPLILPALLFYYSWIAIIRFIISKIDNIREKSDAQ